VSDDDGLTFEELQVAMRSQRAFVAHFREICDRVADLCKRLGEARERGHALADEGDAPSVIDQLAVDAAALVGYLQLMLDENERLVAYLMGLEEAGTISRAELEFLMGLRRNDGAA